MRTRPTPAARKLTKWLAEPNHSQRKLCALLRARGLEVSQQTISRWCRGDDRPSEGKRPIIEEITAVPAIDWMTADERARFEALAQRMLGTPTRIEAA